MFIVQSRQLCVDHCDGKYCAAIFKFMAIEYTSMVNLDDKLS